MWLAMKFVNTRSDAPRGCSQGGSSTSTGPHKGSYSAATRTARTVLYGMQSFSVAQVTDSGVDRVVSSEPHGISRALFSWQQQQERHD